MDGARRTLWSLTAAAATWCVFEAVWVATGTPATPPDAAAALTALIEAGQPPGENAMPLFVEAARSTTSIWQDVAEECFDAGGLDDPAAAQRPDMERLRQPGVTDLEWELRAIERMEQAGVFATLRRAAGMPRVVRHIDLAPGQMVYDLLMPELGGFRQLARARVAMMHRAALGGDRDEMVRAFEDTLALCRAAGSQCFLIDRLVSHAIGQLALGELEARLVDGGLDEGTAMGLLAAMDRQLKLAPLATALEAERLSAEVIIHQGFTDDRHGDGRLRFNGLATGAPGLLFSTRARTRRVLDRWYDGQVRNAGMSPADLAAGGFDDTAFLASLSFRDQLVAMLLPPLEKVRDSSERLQLSIAATRVALALAAHRAARGAYPDSLEELVPHHLAEPPVDPTHGGALGYRRLAGPGAPYVLYSTGVDRTDQTASAAEPASAWSFGGSVWDEGSDVALFTPSAAAR